MNDYEKQWASGEIKPRSYYRSAELYPLENPYPKFMPYDLCWVKGTKELVLVTEVNCNKGQTSDQHQWSFAVEPLTPDTHKCAWYDMDELEFIRNIFDVIAKKSMHPFSSSNYEFSVSGSTRRPTGFQPDSKEHK